MGGLLACLVPLSSAYALWGFIALEGFPVSSQNKLAWTYTDDAARTWRRAADKAITDQGGGTPVVGGAAAAATVLRFPTWIKPRVALVNSSTGVKRRVVLYDHGAPLATIGATVTLETAGADVTFTTYGTEGERTRNGISQSA